MSKEGLYNQKYDALPPGWEFARLGDIIDIQGGSQPPKSTFLYEPCDGYVRLLQIRDFGNKPVPTYVPKDKVTKFCEKDDIFIARYGASLGRIVTGMEGAYNVALAKVILDKNAIYPKYMFYLLQTPIFQTPIHMISRSAQNGFNKGEVFPIQVPIAPYEQQKRIVAEIEKQFSRLDEAVANLKRVKANLKRYKAAVLKAAVEGKLTEEWRKQHPDVEPASKLLERILAERRKKWEEAELAKMKAKGKVPKDDNWKKKYKVPATPDTTDLPELPKEWVWVTWESILAHEDGAFKRGPFGSALKKSIFVESGYKVYEQYCPINDDCSFGRYFITEEKFKEMEGFSVKARDFLISCSGVTLGRITQVPDEYEEGVINQALLRVRVNGSAIDDSFFIRLFRSPHFQKQVFANSQGAAIPNVKGVKELKAIPIPLPPLEEQHAVVQLIDERMSVVSEIEKQVDSNLKRAERLSQSIMSKAFSGLLFKEDVSTKTL